MKTFVRNLSIIACLFFSFSVVAQKSPSPPPGTVLLKPSKTEEKHATFIDIWPLTVMDWLEYMYWTEKEYGTESVEYKAILPDTLMGSQSYPENWRHPTCRNFPMIGISYEQATAYCKWRADKVNEQLKLKKKKYTVSYSMPTETDLKEAFKQWKITYCYPFDLPVNELTAEKTVMIKGWNLSFEPYQGASTTVGFRCVAEIHK